MLALSWRAQALEVEQLFVQVGRWEMPEQFGLFRPRAHIEQRCSIAFPRALPAEYALQACGVVLRVELNEKGQLTLSLRGTNRNKDYGLGGLLKTDATYYGLGTQYSHFVLNGRKFPVLSQEQGNGRGLQPITFYQSIFARGLAGHSKTSYGVHPILVNSNDEGLVFDTLAFGEIDLKQKGELGFWFHGRELTFEIFKASGPLELLENISADYGRMRPLPEWVHRGLIAGLVGGEEVVTKKLKRYQALDVPLAGLWMQDWAGVRQTLIGERLIWDWQRDEARYPKFPEAEVPRLGYFNPFIAATDRRSSRKGEMFEQASRLGYLMSVEGRAAPVRMGGFEGHLVNLFRPEARAWFKALLKEQVEAQGFAGWMADFGEAWSYEADLPIGIDPTTAHHQYILEWLALNREIVDELGPDHLTFFARASAHRGAGLATLYWLGDQMPTWDDRDGLKSVLIGLLSSGLSGKVYNHADLGGYAELCFRPFFCYRRTPELMKRWLEMSAFTALMRSHEGLNPESSLQLHTTPAMLLVTSYWTQVFKILAPYRKRLISEASERGIPVVRPMFLHASGPEVEHCDDQFFLGPDLLVAPVLEAGATSREVFLPQGEWTHLFTGKIYRSSGERYRVGAPIGTPPVFYRFGFSEDLVRQIHDLFYPLVN